MRPSIITTKLYIPHTRPNAILRQRLTDRLTEGLHRKMTLVSASAGYGKTTLVSEWLSRCERPAAWLSLDAGDGDLQRFLTYVIAAMHSIAPQQEYHTSALLQSAQSVPVESILTELINDFVKLPEPFILVLDDYHVLHGNSPVHAAMAFVLEHMPPKLHIVIITREDPDLPLVQLRVKDEITELDAADLRFSHAESTEYLNRMMALSLSLDVVSMLESRTEGWIAGLQIAALSMKSAVGQKEPSELLGQSLLGNRTLLLDYMLEEVWKKQPEAVQKFLLCTSILERFCGPLSDALLSDPASSGDQIIAYLDRAHLFIISLDAEKRWYRYHPLFAEVLRDRLLHRTSHSTELLIADAAALHTRASLWYETNGFVMDAFHHAAAANDIELAARLAEGGGMPLHLQGEAAPVLRFLESLPRPVLDARPSLWVIWGSALLMVGRPTEVEPKLQAAETVLQDRKNDDNRSHLMGMIAATRAAIAAIGMADQPSGHAQRLQAAEEALQERETDDKTNDLVGQIPPAYAASAHNIDSLNKVISLSKQAITYLKSELIPVHKTMFWLMGSAYQLRGDRNEAREAYQEVLSLSRGAEGNTIGTLAVVGIGNLLETENRLYESEERYLRALQLTGNLPLPAACEAHLGIARIYCNWNNLENAMHHAELGLQLAQQLKSNDIVVSCKIMIARIKLASHSWDEAAAMLTETQAFARANCLIHRLSDIAEVQAQLRLCQGNLNGAMHLAQLFQHPMILSRVHLAKDDPVSALAVIESYRSLVEAKGRTDLQLRAMIVQSAARYAQGEKQQAAELLNEALELGESGGSIRPFIEEGMAVIAPLFTEASALGRLPEYVAKLLDALESEKKPSGGEAVLLSESLTQRELEVLQLIASGLSNREIGEKLFLALDTVKGHNRRIFEKLQVRRRTEAIALARKLGWIE